MTTILIILLIFLGSYFGTALFLWLGAKWVHIPHVTFWRTLAATFAIAMFPIPIRLAFMRLWSEIPVNPWLAWGLEVCTGLLITWLALKVLFRTSLWRAIGSWLPTLVPTVAIIALFYLVLRPYVLEAYILPAHAMAPTLLGPHQRGVCSRCGQTATVSYHPEIHHLVEESRLGMCGSCQQAGEVDKITPTVYPPDRILVNKLLTPRRWDLIVFRPVKNPSALFVMRLVGFPGEEVIIKEGKIWINGIKQEPPVEIAKLTFGTLLEKMEEDFGSPERPMRVGDGEYFTLGDFSLRSYDSRAWGALPGKNIEGVVTAIYWPFSRWHLFR